MMGAAENPFRVQKIHSLCYRSPTLDWRNILARLESNKFRGAICGPHGHGKTTLVNELERRLADCGFDTRRLFLNDESPRFTLRFLRGLRTTLSQKTIVLLDGADQLSPFHWRLFRHHVQHAYGLVITTRQSMRLTTLYECTTSPEVLDSLLDELLGPDANTWRADAHRLFDHHNGNIREVFFALYDSYATLVDPPTKKAARRRTAQKSSTSKGALTA